MPGFFVRGRPGRASPRKTKKAGDFPARKPGEPSVTNVARRIEFHLLYPWQITLKQGHWAKRLCFAACLNGQRPSRASCTWFGNSLPNQV